MLQKTNVYNKKFLLIYIYSSLFLMDLIKTKKIFLCLKKGGTEKTGETKF